MKLHILKIQKQYFDLAWNQQKKAELRQDDRGYEVYDLIHFVDVDGKEFFNYKDNLFMITHILRNVHEYGLMHGYAMLSIKKVIKGELL